MSAGTIDRLAPLQGRWYIHALEKNGAPVPSAAFSGATITVTGDSFTTAGMGPTYCGRLVADISHLELHFTEGPENGKTNRGIYRLEDGQWTLCLSITGGPAPVVFSTSGQPGVVLETMRRQPPAGTPVQATEPTEAIQVMQGNWTMLSCIRDGKPLPPSMVKQGRRNVRGVDFVLQFGSRLFQSGNLYSVPGRPDAFDLDINDVGLHRGIFDLTGDRLTTCFGAPGGERPEDFSSSEGSGRTLAEWQRAVR